jgi:flagellar hook protein FlgE
MSLNTAISGLNAATADLNTIGNNVANSSTNGFKLSRAEFADVYPVSGLGSSSNTIGSGVKLAAVTQQFTQGNINFTNKNLDLAVNGQGFFRLSDNGSIVYSRAGAFGIDRQGYISNSSGLHLTGYLADATGNITGALGDLQLSMADIAPNPTANINVGINLDASATAPVLAFNPANAATYNNATSTTVYDSLGTTHLTTLYYRKTAANTWETYLYVDGVDRQPVAGTPDTLVFSNLGALATVNGAAVPPGTVTSATFNPGTGAANMTMATDYSTTTQFGSPFGVNSLSQDGYTTGRLSGVDISDTGIVYARYSNSQSRAQGQVVLTNFANTQGLRPLGDTNWTETPESGVALTGAPNTASLGVVQSGALEDSNVNLTEQLVALITAQRNFQANAQVITTENAITQTIIQLR